MIIYTLLTVLSVARICQSQDPDLPPLPTPTLTKITIFNSTGFTVEWAPVTSDENNPVAGFKVKLWENEKELHYDIEDIDGLGRVMVENIIIVEKPINIIPKTEPWLVTVEGNTTIARFEDVKLDEDYQIRVQAFNDYNEDGPYSNVLGIKILDSKN